VRGFVVSWPAWPLRRAMLVRSVVRMSGLPRRPPALWGARKKEGIFWGGDFTLFSFRPKTNAVTSTSSAPCRGVEFGHGPSPRCGSSNVRDEVKASMFSVVGYGVEPAMRWKGLA